MKMIDRIRAFQSKDRGTSNHSNANNTATFDNIFFDFSEGLHRIRLVGDFVCSHSHWIGPTKFNRLALYPEDAFKGDNAIKRNANCADFSPDTEMMLPVAERQCVLCRLRATANDILYKGKGKLEQEQKDMLSNIALSCRPNERYFFNCIDRDNPEIAPGKKGLKIIEFPRVLFEQWVELAKANPECDTSSDDEGIDLNISKTRDANGRLKYSVNYVIAGKGVLSTPLTDEERAYQVNDIKKIMCRMPNQQALYDNLLPEYKAMIEPPVVITEPTMPAEEAFNETLEDEENIPF